MNNDVAGAIKILESFVDDIGRQRIIRMFGCDICAICGQEVEVGMHHSWCTVTKIEEALALLREIAKEGADE